MLGSEDRFIFVHVPKTAGSSLLAVLLPHSRARKTIGYGDDGREFWGIKDPIVNFMHAPLTLYDEKLRVKERQVPIVAGFREPFERMVSLFFSPDRSRRPPAMIEALLKAEARLMPKAAPIRTSRLGFLVSTAIPPKWELPHFSEEAFLDLAREAKRHVDLLRYKDGSFPGPSSFLPIRQRNFEHDAR